LLFIALFLLVLGLTLFTSVETTDYQQTLFYKSTMARVDSLVDLLKQQEQPQGGSLKAGWGVANITPNEPVRLTGKNFSPYHQVLDSIFVRTILFNSGSQKIVLLSYDLWIIHPFLAIAIRDLIKQQFSDITGIYFTANHTHTSIGGWASGLLGSLVVGGNHPEMVAFLGEQTIKSLRQAEKMLCPVTLGSGEIVTNGLVANRLNQQGLLDNKLRVLKMINDQGQVAVFNTFSAHSIYMNKDINTLSADYPGPFLDFIKYSEDIHFASFAPGATGSHTPIGRKPFKRSKMLEYSRELASYFSSLQGQIKTDSTTVLKYIEWPVDLRSPHFRVSNHIRFRPWLFNSVMGASDASITALRVGNTVLVGLPIELSGEFYVKFEAACKQRGLSLIITSFNGKYLGYVNPESYYYTLNHSETRGMNWFGPQNGEYFVDLVNKILEII